MLSFPVVVNNAQAEHEALHPHKLAAVTVSNLSPDLSRRLGELHHGHGAGAAQVLAQTQARSYPLPEIHKLSWRNFHCGGWVYGRGGSMGERGAGGAMSWRRPAWHLLTAIDGVAEWWMPKAEAVLWKRTSGAEFAKEEQALLRSDHDDVLAHAVFFKELVTFLQKRFVFPAVLTATIRSFEREEIFDQNERFATWFLGGRGWNLTREHCFPAHVLGVGMLVAATATQPGLADHLETAGLFRIRGEAEVEVPMVPAEGLRARNFVLRPHFVYVCTSSVLWRVCVDLWGVRDVFDILIHEVWSVSTTSAR